MFGKSICCLLCRASILFFDASGATKFARHMQFEHGAMHDLEFMLAACKMNESEKKALVEVFNKPSEKVEVKNTSVCKKEHKDTILVDSKHKANNTNLPVVGNMKATNVSLDKENTDQKEKHVKDGTAKVKVSKESSDVNFKDKTKKKKKLAIESDEKIKRDNIEMKKPENIVQRQKKRKNGYS